MWVTVLGASKDRLCPFCGQHKWRYNFWTGIVHRCCVSHAQYAPWDMTPFTGPTCAVGDILSRAMQSFPLVLQLPPCDKTWAVLPFFKMEATKMFACLLPTWDTYPQCQTSNFLQRNRKPWLFTASLFLLKAMVLVLKKQGSASVHSVHWRLSINTKT